MHSPYFTTCVRTAHLLRPCCSATRQHAFTKALRQITTSTSPQPCSVTDNQDERPITDDEFEAAFLAAWKPLPTESRQHALRLHSRVVAAVKRQRIAIAVSGGVDSMALAFMCQRLARRRPNDYEFIAVVVDHRARPESKTEAAKVVEVLRHDLGLKTLTTSITWTEDPTQMSAFESNARTARFQAIGKLCYRFGARYVLLGHHQDDQVETIITRTIAGRTGAGLAGIKPTGAIPSCHGIFGVAEGPGRDMLYIGLKEKLSEEWILPTRPKTHGSKALSMAGEGITLHRPLLGFGKSRLIATCRQAGIQWQEDETNKDVRITDRNTVRSLLASHRLPVALRKASILKLGTNVAAMSSDIDDEVNRVFDSLQNLRLDPRTGVLTVRLNEAILTGGNAHSQSYTRARGLLIASGVVNRLTSVVWDVIEHSEAEGIVAKIIDTDKCGARGIRKFTGGRLQWTAKMGELTPVWRLSRQPYDKRHKLPACGWCDPSAVSSSAQPTPFSPPLGAEPKAPQSPPAAAALDAPAEDDTFKAPSSEQLGSVGMNGETEPSTSVDGDSTQRAEEQNRRAGSAEIAAEKRSKEWPIKVNFRPFQEWQLFDYRFWIRVYCPNAKGPIVARPLTEGYLQELRSSLSRNDRKKFDRVLNCAAPGSERFTLPVLLDDHGRPLALPTLGFVDHRAPPELRWEWMFKRIRPNAFHKDLLWNKRDDVVKTDAGTPLFAGSWSDETLPFPEVSGSSEDVDADADADDVSDDADAGR